MDELKKERPGGMPWMIVLDDQGEEVTTSVGPKGNVGCPIEDFEIEHFVDMIRKSSDATDEELSEISKAMNSFAEQYRRK